MEVPQTMQISGEEEGDEFYEKIEAPKFVDFTAPDQNRPDDCYWFCLRVGCDQQHEEEMDSEAIYKNFVLRVMAARSPNVRLRKALNRKAPSANVKCPLTAPPKPSKSRISRLALISSISHKLVDTKLKGRPTPKLSATPGSKAKQSSDVAKAHTTPRNRKRLSNPNTFRSVRNPKVTTIVGPKNRVVAKALVFNSPKKAVKTKTSLELNTPVKTLCAAMKKLEITSEKKHVLGYNKSLPIDASRKQIRGREVKSRVYDSLHSHNRKVQEAKTSRCLKRNINKDIKPPRDHKHHEGDDDSSDMDIDEKSRNGSLEGCSLPGTSQSGRNGQEECLKTVKSQEGEYSVEPEFISLSSSEEGDSGQNDGPDSQARSGVAEGTSEGSEQDEKIISSPEKGKIPEVTESDDKENALACDDTENDSEANDNEEKENTVASDDNRLQNHNNGHQDRIVLGEHDTSKISLKINRVMGKAIKEGSLTATTGAQGVKHRKPKPTNPKPFRLRTDERGILKEANFEKKLIAPLTEITTAPGLPGTNSQRKHQNASQKKKKRLGLDRTTLEDQSIRVGSTCLKASKGKVEQKLSLMTLHRRSVSIHHKSNLVTSPSEQDKACQKQQNNLKKIQSPMMQQKLARPRGVMSSRKEAVSLVTPGKLGVIKENPSKILTTKQVAKPTKASSHTTPRSSSRGRRPPTIPKEPTFHSIHTPKSCTRKLA
ncbi:hypothetical protein F2P56_028906 [Juglans regia]|uniref:Uncharacterized protein n=2 Tax=Juglans regia TaxID=51240 RepID=A0A833TXB6_JUGRE|nr:uncharacterized protein LOC109008704 isoform X1 [Juglans regia]KAF5448362.1 hypothetical protein F2P56_028906 [Juglans regia]